MEACSGFPRFLYTWKTGTYLKRTTYLALPCSKPGVWRMGWSKAESVGKATCQAEGQGRTRRR